MADEPVTARDDPLLTRLGRWARKHKLSTATVAATLVVGLAGALYGYQLERTRSRKVAQRRVAGH